MNKEELMQEYRSKQLIDELSKMPPMVIATAYLHAINYTLYGVSVTEKWITATENASALEKAYNKGYYDALQRQVESRDKECENCEHHDYCAWLHEYQDFGIVCNDYSEAIEANKVKSEDKK